MFIFGSYAQRIWQRLFFANDTIEAAVTNVEAIASPLEQPGAPVTTTDLPVPGPFAWDSLGWGEVGEPEWFVKHIWVIWLWDTMYGPRSRDSKEFREVLYALPEIVLKFWGIRFIYVLLWACRRWNRLLATVEQIIVTVVVEVVATLLGRRGPFLRKLIVAIWNCVRYGPQFLWIFVWELRRSLRAVYGRQRELDEV